MSAVAYRGTARGLLVCNVALCYVTYSFLQFWQALCLGHGSFIDFPHSKGKPWCQHQIPNQRDNMPAGLAALASRRAAMANVYDALAIGGFLRASGITGASYSLTRSDTAYEETWTLP